MFAFHFDFNTAHFQIPYLKKYLRKLHDFGYDTIIWELEDFVKFESAPLAAASDAISKDEFSQLLDYSRSLGLVNVPLLQTLAHVEYVLRVPQYSHLSEGDSGYLYCPNNPEVYNFLSRWIAEYKELFYDAPFFHAGCDETLMLGESCQHCNHVLRNSGTKTLLIEHICKIRNILKDISMDTAIWADMIVNHPECMEELPRDIILFEWRYNIFYGNSKLWCPGYGLREIDEFPAEIKEKFQKFLFPNGETANSVAETFYLADYLKSLGFKVILSPSTSSYGGNVFCGEAQLRFFNTFDAIRKSHELDGCAVTSWSVHLYPYELQEIAIAAVSYHKQTKRPKQQRQEYCNIYTSKHFNSPDSQKFMLVLELLSSNSIFLETNSVGHSKAFHAATLSIFLRPLENMNNATVYAEINKTKKSLNCAFEALEIIRSLIENNSVESKELQLWHLTAENIIARCRFALAVLHWRLKEQVNTELLLKDLSRLRCQTKEMYQDKLTPQCQEKFLALLFDLPMEALKYLYSLLPVEDFES